MVKETRKSLLMMRNFCRKCARVNLKKQEVHYCLVYIKCNISWHTLKSVKTNHVKGEVEKFLYCIWDKHVHRSKHWFKYDILVAVHRFKFTLFTSWGKYPNNKVTSLVKVTLFVLITVFYLWWYLCIVAFQCKLRCFVWLITVK